MGSGSAGVLGDRGQRQRPRVIRYGPALAEVPYVVGLLRQAGLRSPRKTYSTARSSEPPIRWNAHDSRTCMDVWRSKSAITRLPRRASRTRLSPRQESAPSPRASVRSLERSSATPVLRAVETGPHQRRQGEPLRARTYQRLDEHRNSLDPATSTASVGAISLHWLEATLKDLTPDRRTVDALRAAATAVIGQHGLIHTDSSYALMTVAVVACEAAVSKGDLSEVDESRPDGCHGPEGSGFAALPRPARVDAAQRPVRLRRACGGARRLGRPGRSRRSLQSLADRWANRDAPLSRSCNSIWQR